MKINQIIPSILILIRMLYSMPNINKAYYQQYEPILFYPSYQQYSKNYVFYKGTMRFIVGEETFEKISPPTITSPVG